MIAARMRHGDACSRANILNMSSRGLLLHAVTPPSPGTYVEVRRGAYVIIGRVIWAKADRFGVCAQDELAIDLLIANGSPNGRPAGDTDETIVERRTRPRSEGLEWRYAQSREKGRALQIACIAGFGFILAAFAYDAVAKTLSDPLSIVARHLDETQ
jgi:hypothetical protein